MPQSSANPDGPARSHPLLDRQLRKLGLTEAAPPADPAAWAQLLETVRRSYSTSDQDRALLERSIEISSREMEDVLSEVRASNQRFELVTRATTNVIWDWDLVAGKLVWNEHFQTVFLYTRAEVGSGTASWTDRIHPDDAAAVLKGIHDVIDGTGQYWSAEYHFRRGDGTYAFVFDRGYVIRNAAGRAVRMIGAMQDFTERKRHEEELRAAKELAESASAAKSEFLANMSHEIRTPMTAILGFADLLTEEPDTPQPAEQRREYIATIRRHGEHLLSVINDILDISKIEAGKMTVRHDPTPVVETIEEVATLLRVRSDAKGLTLSTAYAPPLPRTIQSDPLRLRQVLINLIGNAIKFTEDGGVRVAVSLDAAGPQPLLRIAVHDSGIGLTPEQIGRLFGAFAQADTSMSRRFGGTGLGLRISKRLAQLLGGDIAVESVHNVGSVFTVTVPTGPLDGVEMIDSRAAERHTPTSAAGDPAQAEPPASAVSGAHTPPLQRALAGVRVLLVEDGPDNQRLIAFHLRRAGATVHVADNGLKGVRAMCVHGDEASPLIEPSPFDVVLMDMQMPEMDGYSAAALLRKKGCRAAIVALTAHAMSGDREACVAAGCTDYATKPIDSRKLIELVATNARAAVSPRG